MTTLPIDDILDERGTVAIFAPRQSGKARDVIDLDLPLISAATFAGKDIPVREDFVEGLIARRTVALLSGDGGTGKSLLAKQLLAATALHANWLGRTVNVAGPVLGLFAEDDIDEIHRRFDSILRQHGAKFDELRHVHLLPMVGLDALLATLTHKNTLETTDLFASIERAIADIRPVLVALDNLSDIFGGNENDRTHARQFARLLSGWTVKYDTTILLLSHPSLSGMSSGAGTSGSTAWNNSVRTRLYLERVKTQGDLEDDPDVRVLKTKKQNYGAGGSEIRLRWKDGVFVPEGGGDLVSTIAATAAADRTFMDMLAAYLVEGRNVSAAPGPSYAPAVFFSDKRRGTQTKRSLTDAMNRLFEQGRIRSEESGPQSKRRKHLVIVEGVEK